MAINYTRAYCYTMCSSYNERRNVECLHRTLSTNDNKLKASIKCWYLDSTIIKFDQSQNRIAYTRLHIAVSFDRVQHDAADLNGWMFIVHYLARNTISWKALHISLSLFLYKDKDDRIISWIFVKWHLERSYCRLCYTCPKINWISKFHCDDNIGQMHMKMVLVVVVVQKLSLTFSYFFETQH